MANETVITVVGSLTSDIELRFTQNGLAVANFTIASNARKMNKNTNEWEDQDPLFMRCSVWREFAEQAAGSIGKGTRVIATGRLTQRSYETKEGEKRTSIELEIDEIGPSLRYATAQVTKVGSNRNQAEHQQRAQSRPQQQEQWPAQSQGDEPWNVPATTTDVWNTPGSYDAEIPF